MKTQIVLTRFLIDETGTTVCPSVQGFALEEGEGLRLIVDATESELSQTVADLITTGPFNHLREMDDKEVAEYLDREET